MNWEFAAATDRGRRRASNEDAFVVRPELGFFVVADGMGGHAAGEVASQMAVDTIAEEFLAAGSDALTPADLERTLLRATSAANLAIFERGERELDKAGMGTTVTALVLLRAGCGWRIAHVGDSRAYRLRAGALEQLTTDHTWVQQQIELGRLRPAEARRHPFANIVTRALGIKGDIEVDLVRGDARPGDLFLLCSDGLTGMVTDKQLAKILAADAPPDAIAKKLIAAANRNGGADNITAVVVRVVA